MSGVAERLLAVLLDGSPVLVVYALLVLFALDVRSYVVRPVLKALGARWSAKIEPTNRHSTRLPD